jgi:DNA polymerase-3 subunit alpha
MSNYIELHNHSTFSISDGFGSPQAIVDRAKELGWNAVALTEHGHMISAPTFYKAARTAGIKPIIGCELYVTGDWSFGMREKVALTEQFHLTVLALSKEGYQNLVAWTSEAMKRENFYRKPRISVVRMAEIAPWPLHHNVVLSGCLASELCRSLENGNGLGIGMEYALQMKSLFPNFYIEIQDHKISKFDDDRYPAYQELLAKEVIVQGKLLEISTLTAVPAILTNDSHLQRPQDRKAHVAMKASAWRSRDDLHYGRSQEQVITSYLADYAYFGNYMRDMEQVCDNADLPRACLASVSEIVEAADIVLDPLDNTVYSIPFSGESDPLHALRRASKSRLANGVWKHGRIARERFEHELESMGDFAHYLVLMAKFIKEAHRQGILTWTRGSAANSYLAYCLGIHEIDSIEYGLTFSRFFNPARKKLPDIDVDIDPERYDDFMRIVQEHMEPLIGAGQVVRMCDFGLAQNRAAFRMAASALGIPKEEQDEISKLLPQMIDSGMVDEDTDVFIALREDYPELYEITSAIFDSVKSVGQHASAWVFGTADRKVEDWIPLYLIASSNALVTQYDFHQIEDFGLVKMDFLRLKTLSIAKKVMQMVGKSPMEFYDVPLDDSKTFEMMRAGDVEGVHTLQGKETRRGIVEMQVENVHDVIVAAALYRPAHTREGRDKLYLQRRRGDEIPSYPHSIVERIVGGTFGIPVFQEQAMEIGYAVGMDDAGVDDIYQAIKKAKGVGKGAKEAFSKIEPKFLKAAKRKMKPHEAKGSWLYVQGFQGYGFNKGHASSYGVLATRMAYLKCHYPVEFFAAILDTFPEKASYIAAARNAGLKFLPPDVNHSGKGFGIDRQLGGIRVGLGKIHGLGPVAVDEIVRGQPFQTYDDFLGRTTRRAVNVKRLENLRTVGAFSSLGLHHRTRDEEEFQLLGFTLGRPIALRGCKPRHVGARTSDSGWKHLGREKGVELTAGRASVSKLFWIPPDVKLELKASPWAQVKTWLMLAVDENGIPVHWMVNEDKKHVVMLLKYLHRKCQGSVICADGMIRLPFVQNGPPGFRFFGVSGTYDGEPQCWHVQEIQVKAILEIERQKRIERYRGG